MNDDSDERYDYKGFEDLPEPSNAFVRAAADGDLAKIRRLLAEGADINQHDEGYPSEGGYRIPDMRKPNTFGRTAIEMAVYARNLEMLKFLIEAGANPAPVDPYEHKPQSLLAQGVYCGFAEGVRYLVEEVNLSFRDANRSDAWLLVDSAREKSTVEMLKYLVEERGLDPLLKTENGITAASAANDRKSPPEMLEYLYSKGAVPSGTQHITPLAQVMFAEGAKKDLEGITGSGFNELEKAMDMASRYSSHSTLLNEAVFHGDIEKTRIHLKNGANPLEKDDGGVDAFGVLEHLKSGDIPIFGYWEEHEAVEKALRDSLKPVRGLKFKGPSLK